ncbi:MAG: pyrroline-5-carboxylate reductase [Lawsonibacter sp.]|nr:pyrroline-5-carboxylate reductase [Lawsonibacter sp.]
MKKVAIIGIGNIGSILAKRICLAVLPSELVIYDHNPEKMERIAAETGCVMAEDATGAAEGADYIFLAVKPQAFSHLLQSILPTLHAGQCIVSTAAGVELKSIEALIAHGNACIPAVRIMPNLPINIGKGCVLISKSEQVTEEQEQVLLQILSHCGICRAVDEEHFDMGVSLNSCTPAYVFMFLEALADGGVALGYSRKESEIIAARAVEGAVSLFLETSQSLGELKDAVCSPQGAAINGVAVLEKGKFRASIINAVEKAFQKNESMKYEL